MNFDYLSQYETNSAPLQDIHIAQLAKQMAYSRMIEEIEYQRNNNTSKMAMNFFDTSSMNVSHLLNDIMIRILTETFEKQQTRQGELLFVKKQNKVKKFNCGYFFFQLRKKCPQSKRYGRMNIIEPFSLISV